MSSLRSVIAATSDETGAVLVLFSVLMSVAILLSAFVIDVGNWFEHERHLQVQADAAALAAASKFEYPCTKTVEQGIYRTAGQYGGADSVITPSGEVEASTTPLYNEQIGQVPAKSRQGEIHEEINHKNYYGQSTGDTTTVEKAPCEEGANMIDVKMTETHLPFFFKVLGKAFDVVPNINAHARVSIVKEKFATAVEPIIESEPVEVRVFYVNDSPDGSDSNYNDETLATGLLTNIGSSEEKGTIKFTDKEAPLPVKINKPHIGVRVALAGQTGALSVSGLKPEHEAEEVCKRAYVECFDEDVGVVPPLLNISGYSMEKEGKATKPFEVVAHKVVLSTPSPAPPGTCLDAYFNNWPLSEKAATCSIAIAAELNYGKESATATGVTVTPELKYTEGFSGHAETKPQTPLKLENGVWTGTLSLPSYYYGNFGSTEVNLKVKCEPKVAKSVCPTLTATEEKTLTDVQRAFSAGPDGSNRIVAAKIFEPGAKENPVPGEKDADAFEVCEKADKEECTHNLATTVELSGSLEDAKKYFTKESPASCSTEKAPYASSCQPIPPFHVFYGDNDQEDDDQFVVSCPPTTNKIGVVALYQEALFHGCAGKYSVNTHGGSCTTEKAAQEKIETEEKTEQEAGEKEEEARKARETKETEERAKWAKEETETKLTKAERTAKETSQTNTRKADETTEAAERKKWEEEEKAKFGKKITAKERKEKEETQTAARVKREAEEKTAREKWAAEEKESKLTKAGREAKEAAQTTIRHEAEAKEATAQAKRKEEERATKEAREKLGTAAHECLGLVEANGKENFNGKNEGELAKELTASFQIYLAKRIEGELNGTHFYCPNKWVNNNEGGIPVIPPNDSRLVQFFVVPFTVTDFERKNEVSPLVPIINFATFYITGWDSGNYEAGQGTGKAWNPKERRDECSEKLFKKLPKAEQEELENETVPLKQREQKEKAKGFDDDTEQPREVVGHLIKYVNVLGEVSGTEGCKLEGLETCEAVLTE
jgi:hypothetical protein